MKKFNFIFDNNIFFVKNNFFYMFKNKLFFIIHKKNYYFILSLLISTILMFISHYLFKNL